VISFISESAEKKDVVRTRLWKSFCSKQAPEALPNGFSFKKTSG
jgi:hypothetical protein